MPTATNSGVSLHYDAIGDGETVVFVPDLGCGAWLWSWQVPALSGGFECLVFDPRGTQRSGGAEDYAVETMAGDVEAILADHGARRASVVGAGVGALVALAYARAYARADRLVLLGAAAGGREFDLAAFEGGPTDFEALLSEEFRTELPEEVDRITDWRRDEDAPEEVRRGLIEDVDSFDASDWLHEVSDPVDVLHGANDRVVPAGAGRSLAEGLPRGRFESFTDGSHWFFVEQARLVNDALVGALEGDPGSS